jgi:sporulation protein YlmC with PRC-barrel domain
MELDMRKTLMLGAAAIALAIAAPTYAGPGDDFGSIQLAQDRTSPGTPGTTPPRDTRADDAAKQRMERLTGAQPADKAAVSADALIGTEVRNTKDQKLGSVKDLVMQDGKITAVIIARGGVLGMGTDYHQVEIGQVKITADMETVVLDLAEEQVKALPKMAYEKGKWGPAPVKADDKSSPPRTAPSAPSSTPPSRGTTPPADKPADKAPEKKTE